MAQMTYAQLKGIVASVVTQSKLSSASFDVTRNNIVGLVDKIGKIVTLDTNYAIDKMSNVDGEMLEYGRIVEEYHQDLLLPQDFDPTGAHALTPQDPSYRPCFYSYPLPRKTIRETLRNNDVERAVNNGGEVSKIVALKIKRIADSRSAYRYEVKREMLSKFIGLCEYEMNQTNATAFGSLTSSSAVGTLVKGTSSQTGILVKKVANAPASWDAGVSGGYIVPLNLIKVIAKPVDSETGEAFIKVLKEDVEQASDLNEGSSLNGNSLGAVEGLILYVKQGVMPSIEVDTLAGAFNSEKLAIPCEVKVVKDFGGIGGSGQGDGKEFAVLMDNRAMALHPSYKAQRTDTNGEGDFVTISDHEENTACISRNAFVKVYKTA